MTVFDELAETNGDEEFRAWLSKVIDAKQEIVTFVAGRLDKDSAAEFDSYLKGSFNLSLVVRFVDGGPKAVIRFPKPGHTATVIRDEKVRNEVQVLHFLKEKTTIPVPQVLAWGLTDSSPQQLGPFIIIEHVSGTSLTTLLKQPTETDQDEVILANDIDNTKLDYVYEQLADYILQLSRLDFSTIGAISKDPSSNAFYACERPLVYNMNELMMVVSNYPTDNFPTTPFTSSRSFLHCLASKHLVHLRTQRNLAETRADAKRRFIARHWFLQLVPHFSPLETDTEPFKLYCDDLQPTNMLADPNTLKITAVVDWEFTNVLPAQFAYDPPWWLLLLGPDMWLENHSMAEFTARYMPRLEQFLWAMERVEGRKARNADGDAVPLSGKMRESWATGRF